MDRRRLIEAVSSAVIVSNLAGCGEPEASPTTTDSGDATGSGTADAGAPRPTDTPETPTRGAAETPSTAPLAGDVPTDIREHLPDRARVIREFLPDTSAASLAVALPTADTGEKQAYCFDAVNCYLRYAWRGGFLDISWTKEDGPADLLGEPYHEVSVDQALRFGDPSAPPETREFRGYTMVEGYPTFHYDLDGVAVDHRIAGAGDGLGLEHRFDLAGTDSAAYFVTGGGADYSASAGEWFDGTLQVPPDAAGSFAVTLEAGR